MALSKWKSVFKYSQFNYCQFIPINSELFVYKTSNFKKRPIVKLHCMYSSKSKVTTIEDLPEYVYAGKNIKPHTRVYAMGVATHGALGMKNLLRPEKGKKVYKYMQRPCRLKFAEYYKVQDIACGYGFTVLSVNNKTDMPSFYGTGVTNCCQIGYHASRIGHPLEMVIEPAAINVPLKKKAAEKLVSCGRAHTMVWTNAEGLWTFGNNSFGQCGRPIIDKECYASAEKFHNVDTFKDKSIEQIECSQDTSFVVSEGKVYSCGCSADGQTGRGTYSNVNSFGVIEGDLKNETVVKISSKADCVLALTEKGEVFGWGNSEYRQLGRVTEDQQINEPKRLNLDDVEGKIIDIAAAGAACFVLTEFGEIWSWGYGILGVGPNTSISTRPTRIPKTLLGTTILYPETKVTKIFAGVTFAAAVTNNGGLYAWGRNTGGNLGLGHKNHQHFPMRVCVASSVVKVSCGIDHMFVLTKSLI